MDMEHITILSNIGSASKKYSVYQDTLEIAWFHLEKQGEEFLASYKINSCFQKKYFTLNEYTASIVFVFESILKSKVVSDKSDVQTISLRVVVPHIDFVQDVACTPEILEKLKKLKEVDPIHIAPALEEITLIQEFFGSTIILYFISDSSFHISHKRRIPLMFDKPMYTIGYHGLSCESVLSFLRKYSIEHSKLISVHLGGGSSVTAIRKGISIYNSM